MIKGFIFDLDGTLADTIEDIGWSVNRMLEGRGFPTLERKDHLANINNGAFKLIQRAIPEKYRGDEEFVRSCLKEYESHYSTHYDVETYAYPDVGRVLRSFAYSGYRLAVLSNKQDAYVKNIVKKLFPDIPFVAICGQSELPTKPNPTSALIIAEKMGLVPDEIAFIGDSQVDVTTAKNSGMIPVAVSWGYRSVSELLDEGAEFVVNDAEELEFLPEMIARR